MRLYLPYGFWKEEDGATVVFARDYMPMWRLRDGHRAERLEPWIWIKKTKETHLWEDAWTPWDIEELKIRLEAWLTHRGLQCLPLWADALPILVHDDSIDTFSKAVGPLQKSRQANLLRSAG